MISIFQYAPFYNRWCNLRARFYNHLCSTKNKPKEIQFFHSVPWHFQIRSCLAKEIAKDQSMRSFLYRLYAKPDPPT